MFNKKINLRYTWLVILALIVPLTAIGANPDNQGVRRYLSLGTSLSVGIQPDENGVNQRTDDGYSDQLFDMIQPFGFNKLKLIKLGCPGETTVTMMQGGICDYAEGSQLAQALEVLHAPGQKVVLITIDMGVNDILVADCIGADGSVDIFCILGALNQIATNLPIILTAIRQVAPNTPIIGMNSYNPFLANWLLGPAGQQLAMSSAQLAVLLNDFTLAPVYTAFGAPVADVAGAFNSNDFVNMVEFPAPGSGFFVPLNVATICALTYNCTPPPVGPNIHANPDGYGVMAGAAAAVLP
jgi:lysophospholipase L1-like esterase